MLKGAEHFDTARVEEVLAAMRAPTPSEVRSILAKARELQGLSIGESATLLAVNDHELTKEIFDAARYVKDEIYGKRVVLFAPLYVSNLCRNDCAYCAFRLSNRDVARRALSLREIRTETEALIEQGHKRVLLVSGEAYPERRGISYIFDAIDAVYSVSTGPGKNIRRVNLNVAPMSSDGFRELKQHRIGTYQIFQETYHEPTYRRVHPRGPKADYARRIATVAAAFEAGIDDVGIGVLFGLYDWRFEVISLLTHIESLEARFGIGPHTISVPRIEPAEGSSLSEAPPHAVGDDDFMKIIAVLRLSVPYTGMILSTRETPAMRGAALSLGISQISAGSRTDPGGYGAGGERAAAQFSLGDTRPLAEVVADITRLGFIPSFCTGCYRRGRVGKDFMDLARPGLIKLHCLPNALYSYAEYLHDYAPDSLRAEGFAQIRDALGDASLPARLRPRIESGLSQIEAGTRDVYV